MIKGRGPTRIGDLLLRKGLIDRDQLSTAIKEQVRRRDSGIYVATEKSPDKTTLGEVLIDLGFVSRSDIQKCLGWQARLRRTAYAMALVTPFFTFASPLQAAPKTDKSHPHFETTQTETKSKTKGRWADTTTVDTTADTAVAETDTTATDTIVDTTADTTVAETDTTVTDTTVDTTANTTVAETDTTATDTIVDTTADTTVAETDTTATDTIVDTTADTTVAETDTVADTTAETTTNTTPTLPEEEVLPSSTDVTQAIDTTIVEEEPLASEEPTTVSSTDIASSGTGVEEPIATSVVLSWSPPQRRENGTDLPATDIGGYEILYKKVGTGEFFSVLIYDGSISDKVIDGLEQGDYEFQIAAFDTSGLYSDFSPAITRTLN